MAKLDIMALDIPKKSPLPAEGEMSMEESEGEMEEENEMGMSPLSSFSDEEIKMEAEKRGLL